MAVVLVFGNMVIKFARYFRKDHAIYQAREVESSTRFAWYTVEAVVSETGVLSARVDTAVVNYRKLTENVRLVAQGDDFTAAVR